MSWTILNVFSKITGWTKATLQWNCLIHIPINPKRWSRARINWTAKTGDFRVLMHQNTREHQAVSALTPNTAGWSRVPGATLGLHSPWHTFIHPFILQMSLFLLHWVFVAARRLSLVAASRAALWLRQKGFSSRWLLLWSTGSAVVLHGVSCPKARGVSPDQGWSLCPQHGQVDSYPLDRQEVPPIWKHRLRFTLCFTWGPGEVQRFITVFAFKEAHSWYQQILLYGMGQAPSTAESTEEHKTSSPLSEGRLHREGGAWATTATRAELYWKEEERNPGLKGSWTSKPLSWVSSGVKPNNTDYSS